MRSVVAHIVSCILLVGISLMTSCREDEVIILAEYERLPLGDNSRSDYAGLYLLNEGNMGSNKCTLDFVDFKNGSAYHTEHHCWRVKLSALVGDVTTLCIICPHHLYRCYPSGT